MGHRRHRRHARAAATSEKQVEYLHIITTVTSNIVGKNIKAVTVESLVAAHGQN